jgi:hypothetical protein
MAEYNITRPSRPKAPKFYNYPAQPTPSQPALHEGLHADTAPEPPSALSNVTIERPDGQVTPLDQAEQDFIEASTRVPQRMPRLKSMMQTLAIALGKTQPGSDWSDVATQVGYGAGAAFGGAFNTRYPAQVQKEYDIQRTGQTLKTMTAAAGTQSLIANRQATADYRSQRLKQFQTALDERHAYNTWRMQTGNRRQDTYESWIQWRQMNGDRAHKSVDDYRQWLQESGERRMDQYDRQLDQGDRNYEQRERQNRIRNRIQENYLELARQREQRLATKAGGDDDEQDAQFWFNTADIYAENAETNESLGNDEEAEDFRMLSRQARLEGSKAAAKRFRRGQTAAPQQQGGGFRYTEADVRQRARAAGKSEEAAVKAARDKKLIPPQ